jgi:hypothetical protein
LVHDSSRRRIIGLAGRGGAGKDTLYETVLRPRGYLRMGMTFYREVWLVSTGQGTWEEIFYTKPPRVRQLLQEDLNRVHSTWDERIWLRTFQNFLRLLDEVVGVGADRVAVCDLRFVEEMRGLKQMGGKIIHLMAPDTNVPEHLQSHRSETELDSPEMRELRDAPSS